MHFPHYLSAWGTFAGLYNKTIDSLGVIRTYLRTL